MRVGGAPGYLASVLSGDAARPDTTRLHARSTGFKLGSAGSQRETVLSTNGAPRWSGYPRGSRPNSKIPLDNPRLLQPIYAELAIGLDASRTARPDHPCRRAAAHRVRPKFDSGQEKK